MWDCINTFNTCTFEKIYKIEDELYNFSENEYMKLFLILLNSKFIVYYQRRECQRNSARACSLENKSF